MRWFGIYKICLTGILFLAQFLLPSHASGAGVVIDHRLLPYTFQMQYAEMPGNSFDVNPDSLDWKNDVKRYRNRYSDRERRFLLKSEFTVDASVKDSLLYLCIPSSTYFCRVYLNGNFLAQRGTRYPHLNEHQFVAAYYLIPATFLNGNNEVNTLTVELTSYRDYQGAFPRFELMTLPQAERFVFVHNLFNIDTPLVLFALGMLTAVFFLLIFFAQTPRVKDPRYLLFAIVSFLYGLSYVDYAFSSNIAHSDGLQKISVLALSFGWMASLLFVVAYHRIGKQSRKRWNTILLLLLPFMAMGFTGVLIFPAWQVANVFNGSIAYLILPCLFINLVVCAWFLRRNPCLTNVMMVVAYALAIAGTMIDAFELLSHNDVQYNPFALLFMLFTLLYIFSLEFSTLVKKLFAKEAVLQHQNEIMERTIEQRTRELQVNNDKLFNTVAELKTSNAVKDRFFSIMAHDIKNPLNSMIGFSDLLRDNYDDFPDDQRKEFIHQISIGSNGLYKLLENLLEWSRVQIGGTSCSPDTYLVSDLIGMISPLIESPAAAKGVRLKYAYSEGAAVYADKNMLITILRNLLGNAIKFSYPGSEVELAVDTDDHVDAIFTVTDHGTGMTAEKAANLFRIDAIQSTPGTGNEQGTGLGLILCKEFIDLQGGSIEVHSREGEGTRIMFRLPKKGV